MTNEEFDGYEPGDGLPSYEELAYDHEPVVAPEPHKREHRTNTMIVMFALLVAGAWALSLLLHQQYDVGYSNGSKDVAITAYNVGEQTGYSAGEQQGKVEAGVALQEWEYKYRCAVDSQGFVRLKVTRDEGGQVQYECVVKRVNT